MDSAHKFHLFYFSEIIYLNTFLKFLNFVHVTFILSILPNHTKHLKGLMPYYIPPLFTDKLLYINLF